jgi:hypothetical protein
VTYYEDDQSPEDIITREDMKIAISRADAERIQEIAADKLASKLYSGAYKQIEAKVDAAIALVLNDAFKADLTARTQAAIDKFLVEPVAEPAWRAGSEPKLLVDLVQPIVKAYLVERVNKAGEAERQSSYQVGSRFEFLTTKHVQTELDKAIKKAVSDVTDAARQAVGRQVGKFVAEQMVPAFDLKAITSQS